MGLRQRLRSSITYPWARRIIVGVIGGTLLLIGIAMLALPGPGLVVIPVGLGILGLEFAWARSWLRRLKHTARDLMNSARGRKPPPA